MKKQAVIIDDNSLIEAVKSADHGADEVNAANNVQRLLEQQNYIINLNAQDDEGDTALHLAITRRNLDIIELLLSLPETSPHFARGRLDINALNAVYSTPIQLAIYMNNLEIIEMFFEYYAQDINIYSRIGNGMSLSIYHLGMISDNEQIQAFFSTLDMQNTLNSYNQHRYNLEITDYNPNVEHDHSMPAFSIFGRHAHIIPVDEYNQRATAPTVRYIDMFHTLLERIYYRAQIIPADDNDNFSSVMQENSMMVHPPSTPINPSTILEENHRHGCWAWWGVS